MPSDKKILCLHRRGYVFNAIVPVLTDVCARRGWCFREEPQGKRESLTKPVSDDLCHDADLIIRGRTGWYPFGMPWPYTPNLDKHFKKVVALDDADGTGRTVEHLCAYYLKREYIGDTWQKREKAIPFSMCAPRDVVAMEPLPWEDRDIDLFVSVCFKSGGIREKLVKAARGVRGFTVVAHGFKTKQDGQFPLGPYTRPNYLDLLRRSKIAIAPCGKGQDTNTYWEVPACGVALLAERRTITIANNFAEGEEALFFETPEEMLEQCVVALQDQERLKEMAFAGRAKVLKYHTAEKRVETLLEIAKPILERS